MAAALLVGLLAVFYVTHARAATVSGRGAIHQPVTGDLAALDHFAVTGPGGTPIGDQNVGQPIQIEVTAEDASNQPVTDFSGSVDISSNFGCTTGCDPDVGGFSSGVMSTAVTLSDAGEGATVTATVHDLTGAYLQIGTSDPFTVTGSPTLDHFAVTKQGGGAIGSVSAGGTVHVQITAEDADDNPVTSFDGAVDITSTNVGCTGCVENVSEFTNGARVVNMSFTQAGDDNTITATNHDISEPYLATGTSDPFTVTAAALHHFAIETIGDQTAGQGFPATATAKDQYGNTVTSFSGPVTFTSSGSTCSLSCNSGFTLSAGSKTVLLKLTTATASARVLVSGGTKTGSSNLFAVAPAPLDHFALGAIGQQTAGTPFSVQAAAKDAFGNTVTSYTGPAAVSALNTTCFAGCANVPFSGGMKMFSVTVTHTSTTAQIKVSGSSKSGTSNMFTVVAGAPKSLAFTSLEGPLAAGSTRLLTTEVRDQYGNPIGNAQHPTVTFSQTGVGTVDGLGNAIATNGVASRLGTGHGAGMVTIHATSPGLIPDTSTFLVTAGHATKLVFTSPSSPLASGTSRALSVQVQDASGNLVTSSNAPVTFSQVGGAGSVSGLGLSSALVGVATKTVTGGTAGPVSIRASASGGLTPAVSNFTVIPGVARKLVFINAPTSMKVATTKNFNVEVRDVNENRVTSPAVTVTFEKATGAGAVSFTGGPTVLSSNGLATKTVQATGVGTITLRARTGSLTPALAPLTITR